MFKLPSLLVAPTLGLVLSLSLFSAGAFAQGVGLNAVNGVIQSAAMQPKGTMRPHDGPSPIDMGGGNGNDDNGGGGYSGNGNSGGGYGDNGGGYGGYGGTGYNGNGGGYDGSGHNGNGYGDDGYDGNGNGSSGYAGLNNRACTNHRCANNRRARRCVRLTNVFKSHLTARNQSYLSCKWITAERR